MEKKDIIFERAVDINKREEVYEVVKFGEYFIARLKDGTFIPKQKKLLMEDSLNLPAGIIKCTVTIEFFSSVDEIRNCPDITEINAPQT